LREAQQPPREPSHARHPQQSRDALTPLPRPPTQPPRAERDRADRERAERDRAERERIAARTSPYGEAPALPARSGPDRVVLLARDPFFGHAYWELAPERIHRAIAELGGKARGVLRLVDIEHGDIIATADVYAERGRFVLRFPAGDRRYGLELGLESESGRVIVLLHSNVVMVPPCIPREKGEVVFVDLAPQREVLEHAMDLVRPPRLRVDYADPAKPRRPPPIGSIAFARQAAANAVREGQAPLVDDAAAAEARANTITSAGSEPRLAAQSDSEKRA
jgi:hypothetical protein